MSVPRGPRSGSHKTGHGRICGRQPCLPCLTPLGMESPFSREHELSREQIVCMIELPQDVDSMLRLALFLTPEEEMAGEL